MCDATGGDDENGDQCAKAPRKLTADGTWYHIAGGTRLEFGTYQVGIHVLAAGDPARSESSDVSDPPQFRRLPSEKLRIGPRFSGAIDQFQILGLSPSFCSETINPDNCYVEGSFFKNELYDMLQQVRLFQFHSFFFFFFEK